MTPRTRTYQSLKWPPDDLGEKGERIFADLVLRLAYIAHVVGFGTALGIHRDGKLIPTDTDIDINIQPAAEKMVRIALADWPIALERYANGELRQIIWYPEQVIVDVMLWRPGGPGFVYEKFSLGSTGFTPDWRDTPYGRVPLPGGVEQHMEDLFGETWRIPKYRVKP